MLINTALLERSRYTKLENSIIPVKGKVPFLKAWQSLDSSDLWQSLDSSDDVNLALKTDKIQVIDCDSQDTAYDIQVFLEGLGLYDVPSESSSRGQHFFIRTDKMLDHKQNLKGLNGQFLTGKSACATIAPSTVAGISRQLNNCTPENLFEQTPTIKLSDLGKIIKIDDTSSSPTLHLKGLKPVLNQKNHRIALNLINTLEFTGKLRKGSTVNFIFTNARHEKVIKSWLSRSDFEVYAVTTLQTLGFCWQDVLKVFEATKPGHYMNTANPKTYLRDLWELSLAYLIRPKIEKEYSRASILMAKRPDMARQFQLYAVLLRLAWQKLRTNDLVISFSQLAEVLAFKHPQLIANEVNKLETTGLIKVTHGIGKKARGSGTANAYDLTIDLILTENTEAATDARDTAIIADSIKAVEFDELVDNLARVMETKTGLRVQQKHEREHLN